MRVFDLLYLYIGRCLPTDTEIAQPSDSKQPSLWCHRVIGTAALTSWDSTTRKRVSNSMKNCFDLLWNLLHVPSGADSNRLCHCVRIQLRQTRDCRLGLTDASCAIAPKVCYAAATLRLAVWVGSREILLTEGCFESVVSRQGYVILFDIGILLCCVMYAHTSLDHHSWVQEQLRIGFPGRKICHRSVSVIPLAQSMKEQGQMTGVSINGETMGNPTMVYEGNPSRNGWWLGLPHDSGNLHSMLWPSWQCWSS